MYSMHPEGFAAVAAYLTILCIYAQGILNVGLKKNPARMPWRQFSV